MDTNRQLIKAMATECRRQIAESGKADPSLPFAAQPKHLDQMCAQIEKHAERGREAKLHRWLGFVQCAMLANRMLDLAGLKAMFDGVKLAHAGDKDADNLIDHLDPSNGFELDLGGEG